MVGLSTRSKALTYEFCRHCAASRGWNELPVPVRCVCLKATTASCAITPTATRKLASTISQELESANPLAGGVDVAG